MSNFQPGRWKPVLRKLEDGDERNWRQHKEMRRYAMLMDWKNIAEMFILPKTIYIFNAILPVFFAELEQS